MDKKYQHTKDGDCVLDDTDCCIVCGVWHGDPCPECGGKGFHKSRCVIFLEDLKVMKKNKR